MLSIIDAMCAYCNNYFESEKISGHYAIENGNISLPFIYGNQYYRIIGSKFNDGVYINSEGQGLTDEEFDGEIWAMNIPKAFLDLSQEIKTYIESGADKVSGYTSESFGGYSYSKASAESNAWENAFASKLKRWRKLVNIWP